MNYDTIDECSRAAAVKIHCLTEPAHSRETNGHFLSALYKRKFLIENTNSACSPRAFSAASRLRVLRLEMKENKLVFCSTHVVLHIYCDGLILEESNDVHVTLPRRPVHGVVSILQKYAHDLMVCVFRRGHVGMAIRCQPEGPRPNHTNRRFVNSHYFGPSQR